MGSNYKELGFHWWLMMVLCKIVHLSNSRTPNHYSLLFLSVSTAIDRKFNELRLWKFQFHWTCLRSLLISDQNKCAHQIDHTVAIRTPIIHSPIPPPKTKIEKSNQQSAGTLPHQLLLESRREQRRIATFIRRVRNLRETVRARSLQYPLIQLAAGARKGEFMWHVPRVFGLIGTYHYCRHLRPNCTGKQQ